MCHPPSDSSTTCSLLRRTEFAYYQPPQNKTMTVDPKGTVYEHDERVARASWSGLAMQAGLAIAIVVLFYWSREYGTMGEPFRWMVVCTIVELGTSLFLFQCIYLLPASSPGRAIAFFGSIAIFTVQIVIATNGFGLVLLLGFLVGFLATGWLSHRMLGASLSMHGEAVYQAPFSVKVLLLIAPLFIAMGLIPTVQWMSIDKNPEQHFAFYLILSALSVFCLSLVPILSTDAMFLVLRLRAPYQVAIVALLLACLSAPVIYEWISGDPNMQSVSVFLTFASYPSGFVLAYLPFHLQGFRPVYAKRRTSITQEDSVSFDDVN
jgi:hypothetical protein